MYVAIYGLECYSNMYKRDCKIPSLILLVRVMEGASGF